MAVASDVRGGNEEWIIRGVSACNRINITKHGACLWLVGSSCWIIIRLKSFRTGNIGHVRVSQTHSELHMTGEAVVRIKVIINTPECDKMFAVYSSSKPFIRVIIGITHLHMIDGSAIADAAKSKPVNFIVGG